MSIWRFAGGGFRVRVYLIAQDRTWIDTNQGNYDIAPDCEWLNSAPSTLPATALVKTDNQQKIVLIKFE